MSYYKAYKGASQVPTKLANFASRPGRTNTYSLVGTLKACTGLKPTYITGLHRTFTTTTTLHSAESANKLSNLAQGIPKRSDTLLMGCVCYDPSVGDIWSGIKAYLNNKGVPFDFILFTSYEAQVSSLLDGRIDLAWNGPIAHVLTEEMVSASLPDKEVVSLGMRDCDRDFQSLIVVHKESKVQTIEDLNGKLVLAGASDSPQAYVVPVHYLYKQRVRPSEVRSFDLDIGKHGDTAIGEVKVLETLANSSINSPDTQGSREEYTAAVVSKMMWDRAVSGALGDSVNGQELNNKYEVLTTADVPRFDHCQFDAILSRDGEGSKPLKEKLHQFVDALFAMSMEDSEQKRLMQLEGITKEWSEPRQEGYDIVRQAVGVGVNHRPAVNLGRVHKRAYSSARASHAYTRSHVRVQQHTRNYASKSSEEQTKPERVAVIGAGVAGLQTVRALKDRGINVTAYECANDIGGVWRENYANFGIQVPKQLYEFPDFPMQDAQWGEFADGVKVQNYIKKYADHFALSDSIKLNTRVTGVEQSDKGWSICTTATTDTQSSETKGEHKADFDYLVVATGLYSGLNQFMPEISGTPKQGMTVLHSGDYRDSTTATGKIVLVVGSGKSAIDIAVNASKANAHSVTMLQRNPHWPSPRKIAGLIPFQYVFLSRFGGALVSTHKGTFPEGSGKAINAFRDSMIGRALMKPIFGIVESLFSVQLGLKRGETRPDTCLVSDFYGYANVLDNEYSLLRASGKIQVKKGEIDAYTTDPEAPLRLKDGSTLDADVVVFGTGFGRDFSFFNNTEVQKELDIQDDGLYLYRGIIPPKVPNLAFIGNVATASNIATYGIQAEWLGRKLTGNLVTSDGDTGVDRNSPSQEVMDKEVQAHKTWAREWMPQTASRASLVLLHQVHYHDLLLRDMGLSTDLKSNVLAEYLMPYEPADYKSVISKPEEQVACA